MEPKHEKFRYVDALTPLSLLTLSFTLSSMIDSSYKKLSVTIKTAIAAATNVLEELGH